MRASVSLSSPTDIIRSLVMKKVDRVTDDGLRPLMLKCLSLEILDVEDIYHLTDACFSSVTHLERGGEILTKMKKINIENCSGISDNGVSSIISQCKKLDFLNVSGIDLGDGAFCNSENIEGSGHITPMNTIRMAGCQRISDSSLLTISRQWKQLKSIDLSGCIYITDDGIGALCSYCTNLEEVWLSRCKRLTNLSLQHLAKTIHVKKVNFSECNRITDEGIRFIATSCPNLLFINISRCRNISSQSISFLSKHCAKLQVLQAACLNIKTESFIVEVKTLLPKCKIVL